MLKTKGLSFIAATMSVAVIAMIAAIKQQPRIALQIPKVGWLIYVAMGEQFPPYFDDFSAAKCTEKENCEWLSEGDVIVDVCAKCGTNWMMTAVHELRTWKEPGLQDFRDILDISPWIELLQFPEVSTILIVFNLEFSFG